MNKKIITALVTVGITAALAISTAASASAAIIIRGT